MICLIGKLNTSHLGLLGLNGAKVILGLTILFFIDGVFDFTVFDYFWRDPDEISPALFALFIALLILGANLLGIIIGELLDLIILNYWKGVNNARLKKFNNIVKDYRLPQEEPNNNTSNDSLNTYIFHLFLNGNIWEDNYLHSYRQEFSTRVILLLSFFLMGFFIIFQPLWVQNKVNSSVAQSFILDSSEILLTFIVLGISLLFFSLRTKTEYDMKEVVIKLLEDLVVVLLGVSLYAVVKRLNVDNSWSDILIWFVAIVSILLYSIFIIFVIRRALSNIWEGAKDVDHIDGERIFGRVAQDQWYDLIIYYYELFFHSVQERKLSKMSSYLSLIASVYIYKAIYGFFTKMDDGMEQFKGDSLSRFQQETQSESDGENQSKNPLVESPKLDIRLTQSDLEYMQRFNRTVELVIAELKKENLERALHLYKTLDELILVYFTLGTYYSKLSDGDRMEGKPRLIEEVVPLYIIDSEKLLELIPRVRLATTLGNVLEKYVSKAFNASSEEKNKVFAAIANNTNCNNDGLKEILAKSPVLDLNTLCAIVRNNNADSVTLALVIVKDICTEELLMKVLRQPKRVNDQVISGIISHENCTNDLLLEILDKNPKDLITREILIDVLKKTKEIDDRGGTELVKGNIRNNYSDMITHNEINEELK